MNFPREFGRLALPISILLPPLASIILRYSTLFGNAGQRAALWIKHRWFNHAIGVITVAGWCAIWGFATISALPHLFFWSAPIVSIGLVQLISRLGDRTILDRRWTTADILRLGWWGTVHPTISLLMIATAFNAIFDGRLIGLLWLIAAGVLALLGTVRLQSAQGIRLRRVKSGTLYIRALHLAKKAGVELDRVCVVPPGRGDLTNAFASWRSIALTDNFGEYLHGPQLDAVISHELAHVKKKHTRKRLLIVLALFSVMPLFFFKFPAAALPYRPLFIFVALFLPLLTLGYVSRHFEYEADRYAVELTENPEAAICSLAALYQMTSTPTECGQFVELFMTHPALNRRLAAVAGFGKIPAARVTEILVAAGLCQPKAEAIHLRILNN